MTSVGIDVGTTNVKVVLVDGGGVTLAAAARPLAMDRAGQVAEQDAVALWDAVVGALGEVRAAAGDAAMAGATAVGLCAQYSSIVPVDAEGAPLAPMRLYLDQRGTGHCFDILGRHEDAFMTWIERHPIPPVGGGLALGHVLGFQLDEPELHARTAAYLEPVDYVAARLTGTIAATQVSQFAGQLVDNRETDRRAYDDDLVAMSGVDPTRLPPLIGSAEVVGGIRAEVAAATGLPEGVPVVAGMTDTHAYALALGAGAPGRVGIAIGTTGVVVATVPAMAVDLDHEVLAMPGIRPGEHLVWAENGLAGRAVEHVLDRFVHASDALGDHAVADPFAGFDEALRGTGAGANGVRFLPWLSGSLAPQADPSQRGGFIGLSLDATRADLVRAAAEGVAHNLRWLLGPVAEFTGDPITEVVLAGGAARSPGWCQILADILGVPLRTLADPGHAGSRAVAGWASAVAGGALPDRATEPGLGSAWGERYEPDAGVADVHEEAHGQFVAAFEALRPLRLGGSNR